MAKAAYKHRLDLATRHQRHMTEKGLLCPSAFSGSSLAYGLAFDIADGNTSDETQGNMRNGPLRFGRFHRAKLKIEGYGENQANQQCSPQYRPAFMPTETSYLNAIYPSVEEEDTNSQY